MRLALPLIALAYIGLVLGAVAGWGMNIYALATGYVVMNTPELVTRAIGTVVFPLGALMGWL